MNNHNKIHNHPRKKMQFRTFLAYLSFCFTLSLSLIVQKYSELIHVIKSIENFGPQLEIINTNMPEIS